MAAQSLNLPTCVHFPDFDGLIGGAGSDFFPSLSGVRQSEILITPARIGMDVAHWIPSRRLRSWHRQAIRRGGYP